MEETRLTRPNGSKTKYFNTTFLAQRCTAVLPGRLPKTGHFRLAQQDPARARTRLDLKKDRRTAVEELVEPHTLEEPYTGKKAVVIGAGPAGSTAASFLAQRGFTVEVYEKRSDPASSEPSLERTFHVGLFPTTVKALEQAEVGLPSEAGGFVDGLHHYYGHFSLKPNGEITRQPIPVHPYVSGMRHSIARCLLKNAREKHPDKIHFYFDHECTAVDFDSKTASFKVADSQTVSANYDLLISADGSNSVVREGLKQHDERFTVNRVASLSSYQTLHGLDMTDVHNEYGQLKEPGWVTFGTVNSKFQGKPSPGVLFLNYSETDKLNGMIVGRTKHFENIKGKEKEWFETVKPENLPQQLSDQIVRQLVQKPISQMPPITRVSSFSGPRTVLLGDAGHSLPPGMGLGCNTAIVDAKVLYDSLHKAEGDLDSIPSIFHDLRYKEVQSILDLEEGMSTWGLEQSWFKALLSKLNLLHMVVYTVGHRIISRVIPTPLFLRFALEQITAQQAVTEMQTWQLTVSLLFTLSLLFLLKEVIFTSAAKLAFYFR